MIDKYAIEIVWLNVDDEVVIPRKYLISDYNAYSDRRVGAMSDIAVDVR